MALVVLTLPAWAQTGGSDLDEARKRQEVAAQALEKEIASLLAEADRHGRDAAKAVPLLQQALEKLGPASPLSVARTAELRTRIQERLKALQNSQPAKEPPVSIPTARSFTPAQDQEIKQELDLIRKLQEEKKFDEANQVANRLFARFPTLLAADQSQATTSMDQVVRSVEQTQRDKARGFADNMREIDRSSIPPAGDIQYPSKEEWKRITERAKRLAEKNNPLTPREREILKKLDALTRYPTRFKDAPLNEVMAYLEQELGLPIVLPKSTLQEMNLEYNTPVTVSLPNMVTRRTVLRTVLADLGLTYIIKNEVIQIVSQARANQELVTRVLPVDSLLFGQTGWTPEALIDFIQNNIEPSSWKSGGGNGTITFYPAGRCLIIRNSAEVISKLDNLR
jgi:hypothetical protein